MKRAKCSESEWKDYGENVQSEMDLKDLLEDLGNVIEAASRLREKSKVVEPNTVKDSIDSEKHTESCSPRNHVKGILR